MSACLPSAERLPVGGVQVALDADATEETVRGLKANVETTSLGQVGPSAAATAKRPAPSSVKS